MKIAIVDDELHWHDKIETILCQYDNVEIDNYSNGEEFLHNTKNYDIVFMDIEMPSMDGFDTIKKARELNLQSIYIIMTTHSEMSRKGYLVNAFRYIDKQKMKDEIPEAINSANIILDNNKRISVNVIGKGLLEINLSNILYIETEKHRVLVHTNNDVVRCVDRMIDLENKLLKENFYRCHNAYIVNLDVVNKIEKTYAILKNGEKVEISRRKYQEFGNRYLERKFYCANA